jgi:lysophospholipase L1-like esterase
MVLLLKRFGLTALSLLLLFAADRGCKYYYYSQTYRYYEAGEVYVEDENTQLLFSPDRQLFWKIKPSIELKITENPEQYDLKTVDSKPGYYFFTVKSNAQGLNSPQIGTSKPAGTKRVITLGDSRTMAEGVPFESLYGRRLEGLLNEQPSGSLRYQVINGGVSGYSSYQGVELLKRDLMAYEPDVVTVMFGVNDQDSDLGVSDRQRAVQFDSPLTAIRAQANRSMLYYFLRRQVWQLKAGMFGKTPMRATPRMEDGELVRRVSLDEYAANLEEFVSLGAEHGFTPVFLIVPSSPYAYYPSIFDESRKDYALDDLAGLQQASVLYDRGLYEDAVDVLETILDSHDYVAVRRLLGQCYQQLHRYEDAHEQFVTLSARVIFRKYADVVRRVAREQGVPLIDLTTEFTAITDEMLYVDDMHPSEHGQRLIAAKLAENWRMIERGVVMGVE